MLTTPAAKAMNGKDEDKPNSDTAGDKMGAALLPPPLAPARRALVCADSGYCHFVVVIPRDSRLDLDRLSRALGGARLQVASACACDASAADFRLDTIIDATLAGRDFELEFGSGMTTPIRYADFERQCHPQVAAICLPSGD